VHTRSTASGRVGPGHGASLTRRYRGRGLARVVVIIVMAIIIIVVAIIVMII